MVWVSVKSWKFASRYGLNECLLHFITSRTCIRNKRQMWAPMHSQDQKNLYFVGFLVFTESIPAIISHHPPGTSGKERMRVLQAPLGLHQNNVESKQILFHKHHASKWQSRAATSQPGNSSRGAKRRRKESKKPAALRGETPRSWVSRVSWKILTEQQWNNSLMEMCPLPASRGTPAGTQVGKEPHKKLVWDVSSDAAQPREETQVMLLRNMMAFRNSGTAKRRVRKAKMHFWVFNSSSEPSIFCTERTGKAFER